MSGSEASNLGYGRTAPLSNINGKYVNIDNSHNPSNFSSNEISGTPPGPLPGLAGAKSNIDAANSYVPGISNFKGGAKYLKRKIKNITKKYKMPKKSLRRKAYSLKRKIKSKYSKKSHVKSRRHSRSSRRRQHGGYSQYQNNLPMTPSFALGGHLSASDSALANPPPIDRLSNCTNCVDNYNHYTNKGFPSRGH